MEAAAITFFSSPYFAVAGASQAQQKFGYKVLAWYHGQNLAVTPLNPAQPQIQIEDQIYNSLASPSVLPDPSATSLSIVTPPAITKQLLQEAKTSGVDAVWLQPGSFGPEELDFAKREFKTTIGGHDGHQQAEVGWCVFVDGPRALRAARKNAKAGSEQL